MSQLVETIRILNGRVYNIDKHNNRFNKSRASLYNIYKPIDLRKYIEVPSNYKKGLVKCRILYDQNIESIEFHHYKPQSINSLKCVPSDIEYNFKWTDRKLLKQLLLKKGTCDDILIIKNQKVTDTYIANTAFFKGGKWYTPAQPLLKGSQRARLLEKERILEKDILYTDLNRYAKVAIFNAMLPFGTIILPVNTIKGL